MTSDIATAPRASARDRLLDAANDLFYAEGVHTVGIDRVIERAGVAKATLYNTFGSKDELVEAYLHARHADVTGRIMRKVQGFDTPRARLLGVFEAQGEIFADAGYRGCAFANATAEGHDTGARKAAAEYRLWVRNLFADLVAENGIAKPDELARQLHQLYSGASVGARTEDGAVVAASARAAAESLLNAALAAQD